MFDIYNTEGYSEADIEILNNMLEAEIALIDDRGDYDLRVQLIKRADERVLALFDTSPSGWEYVPNFTTN